MQTRLAICSATELHRLLLAQSQKYFPYGSFCSSTGSRIADPAVHSGPLEVSLDYIQPREHYNLHGWTQFPTVSVHGWTQFPTISKQGDDLEESFKAAENERRQPNIKPVKDNDAFVPPKSPIGSSQKIESTGVHQPINPLTQQKRKNSSNATNNTSFKDINCAGLDGTPWPDEVKDRGAQFEDDKEYFKHHKPSPLAEMEMADTRKPITQATDAADAGIALYPAPDGGVMVWRPEQLDTAEESLLRAMELWKQNAMRGDPDSPQGRILRKLRGENW